MGRQNKFILTANLIAIFALSSCQQATEEQVAASSTPKSLYVASGLCYSGAGITTYTAATASRAVTKWATDSGVSQGVFVDLNFGSYVSAGTVPQALIDKGDSILMLTENATTMSDRKIFKIKKNNPSTWITYANDPSALSPTAAHITRSMAMDVDETLHFSKSIASEKLTTLGVRVTKGGANAWVSGGITGNCFTAAATLIPQIALMTPYTGTAQGKLIYIHAGATAVLNRIGIVSKTGLSTGVAADCITSSPAGGASTVAHTNAPNLSGPVSFLGTGDSLTSLVYIPTPAPASTTGKLLVSYSSSVATAFDNNTNFNYGIVMWDITETSDTAATLNNPVIIWRDETVVWAPSAMAYDSSTNSLFVAVGGAPTVINQTTSNYGYNIEKFTLDINTPNLTRVATNGQPFIIGNAYTKCISGMTIGN